MPYNAEINLEVTKDNKWRNWGETAFFWKENGFSGKRNFSGFFLPNFMSFGTQVEAGSKRMPWLHPTWVFQVGRYSRNLPTQQCVKNMAKTGLLTLANPTLKTFFKRVYRGPLMQM